MQRHTHYQSLGVSPSATQDEIQRAYDQLTYLPGPVNPLAPELDTYERLNKKEDSIIAYEILVHPETRALYDAELLQARERATEASESVEGNPNRQRIYRRWIGIAWNPDLVTHGTSWIGATPTRLHSPELTDTHSWETYFTPPFPHRPVHLEELQCLWQENNFRYLDCDWDIKVSLNPSYAKVHNLLARNTLVYSNNDGCIQLWLRDLEFVAKRREADPKLRKRAVKVEIDAQPGDKVCVYRIANTLLQGEKKDDKASLVVAIWAKPRDQIDCERSELHGGAMDIEGELNKEEARLGLATVWRWLGRVRAGDKRSGHDPGL